jgi:hypothetical protein
MAKIIYEPHPISPARKAKLQADGYKIMDAIFAPAGTPIHQKLDVEEVTEAAQPKVDAEPEVVDELEAEPQEDALVAYEAEEPSFKTSKRGRPKKD